MFQGLNPTPPARVTNRTSSWAEGSASVLHVVQGGHLIGVLGFGGYVRDELRAAAKVLQKRVVKVAMITEDVRHVAKAVVRDRPLPGQKSASLPARELTLQ